MKKLETLEDLAKATGQLAGYFAKNAAFHKAAHAAHAGLHAHHEAQAAFHKAAHDAMDDGHEMKAHIGKVHEHHVAKAAHHKAMSELHKAYSEETEKVSAAFGTESEVQKGADGKPAPKPADGQAPTGIEAMVADTTKGLVSKSLEMLNNDPEILAEIRKTVLEGVKSALGGQIQPDGARRIFETAAPDGLRLIERTGGPKATEKAKVSPQMEDALAI